MSSLSAMQTTATHKRDMSTSSTEIANFIQQFVKQEEQCQQGAFVGKLTGEKGYQSVESGPRYHFMIGLVIDVNDKTVQMDITKGHHYQALAPLHHGDFLTCHQANMVTLSKRTERSKASLSFMLVMMNIHCMFVLC